MGEVGIDEPFIIEARIGVDAGNILLFTPLLIEDSSSVTSFTLQPDIELYPSPSLARCIKGPPKLG